MTRNVNRGPASLWLEAVGAARVALVVGAIGFGLGCSSGGGGAAPGATGDGGGAGGAGAAPSSMAPTGRGVPSTTSVDPARVVLSTEDWTFAGKPGKAIQTANYRFYATETSPVLLGRLPVFMETALLHYRATFAGLPAPPGKLDTFIMATRGQWETLTRQLMGDAAPTYLRIQRGGFASGGRGVFYDIGTADTLSIAGHEGWHQYTQRTFREALPIWLEEGIATTMEGYRWEGGGASFLSWANTERFDQLRSAAARDSLMSLTDIFQSSPQELLAPQSADEAAARPRSRRRPNDTALTYYAQIWALVNFLREGEGGKYREGLTHLVNDAAEGRMGRTIASKLGDRAGRSAVMTRKGPATAMAYFNMDIDVMAQEYARFVEALVRPGSRGPIVQGRSPLLAN